METLAARKPMLCPRYANQACDISGRRMSSVDVYTVIYLCQENFQSCPKFEFFRADGATLYGRAIAATAGVSASEQPESSHREVLT
ncbi:MAG: hypothetical protein FJ279_03875 [Planctomycetes bacterium]|nr:hypothetical protein [Planctomycetota bacterium]